MKTIQLTNEQYEALMQGQSITIEPPKPEKWEPKGGEWFVSSLGIVHRGVSVEQPRLFGAEYSTKEAAEKARDAMRVHNRLLAWLAENDDGWVADWSDDKQVKWFVFYNPRKNMWHCGGNSFTIGAGTIYMSQQNAEKLCKLLNEGVVEL